MAFTGELEHLPLVDIIQLVHTTRKSGIFSVKSDRGESKIVFSNGYIVGANHINNSVRIGTVLVKTGAISIDDLRQALGATKDDVGDREPLLATLIQMGKLKREDALKGLKKLVEMTIVELMSWTKGTFLFDADAVIFSSKEGVSSGDMGPDVVLDAQMVLMDALRIFDERERDRVSGKEVPSFAALYADVLPAERGWEPQGAPSTITADDLGLADIDRLEKKIPRPVSETEVFDPVEIHRQKIKELLAGFSPEEQEAFVAFLKKSVGRKAAPDGSEQQAGKAVVLFSDDRLLRHSVMTICKEERMPVFATDDERDLERIVSQCISGMRMPVVVVDVPAGPDGGVPAQTITSLWSRVRRKFAAVPLLQLASPGEIGLILRAYTDGVRAVLPKPQKETGKATYVRDTIAFLGTLTSYINGLQHRPDTTDRAVSELKKDIRALREVVTPSDAALVLLSSVADMFERAVTFIVRPAELAGERAVGVSSEKSFGPTAADKLRIPLARPSVFRDAVEKGRVYFGESGDDTVRQLFQQIGEPLSPVIVLLPVLSDRKVVAVVYGDFGKRAASPVQLDILEILAYQAGMALEYALFRRQMTRTTPKTEG